METKTHIWTDRFGKKIPVCLMENKHLLFAYSRLIEINYAKKYKGRISVLGGDLTVMSMDSKFENIDLNFTKKWIDIFKEEIEKRKLNLPKIDRLSVDRKFKIKQIKKEQKLAENKKFDDKFT